MRYLVSSAKVNLGSKTCPFLSKMYGINTTNIPVQKLWYLTPSALKPHLIKQLQLLDPSQSCPFLHPQENKTTSPKKSRSSKKATTYQDAYSLKIKSLKQEDRYRFFLPLQRTANAFPRGQTKLHTEKKDIVLWCSNDYLGMGQHPQVLESLATVSQQSGAGSGGTRNIAGTTFWHESLEQELADLHGKQGALVCSSGFVANQAALSAIHKVFPDLVFLSDEQNHASIIEGMRSTGAKKLIFKHNSLEDLEEKLKSIESSRPKLIVFESVYSMSGSIAPIKEICALAKKYKAQTLIDEVHAVGMYGKTGAGVAEQLGCQDDLDFITGTLGKAYGVFGGYVAGNKQSIDCIRSCAPNFIFTTSLPPYIAAAAQTSVRFLRENSELRQKIHERSKTIKQLLEINDIPVVPNPSHIIPLFIGNAKKAKMASDLLLNQYQIYLQPINFPTVPQGEEILRISPTPNHDDQLIAELIEAVSQVFQELEIDGLQARIQQKHVKFVQ